MRLTGSVPTAIIDANPMTDLDQEGISGRLRARFSTYQDAPPRRRYLLVAMVAVVRGSGLRRLPLVLLAPPHLHRRRVHHRPHRADERARARHRDRGDGQRQPGREPDQVLVRLDPRDYEVAVAQARAAVATAKGDLETAVAGVPLTDESTRSLVQQADAALGATQHGTEMARARPGGAPSRDPVQAGPAVAAAEAAVRARPGRLRPGDGRSRSDGGAREDPARGPAGVGARGGRRTGPRTRRSTRPASASSRRAATSSSPRRRSARSRPRSPSRCDGWTRAAPRSRTHAASASRCGSARRRWRRRRAGSPRPSPTCSRRS